MNGGSSNSNTPQVNQTPIMSLPVNLPIQNLTSIQPFTLCAVNSTTAGSNNVQPAASAQPNGLFLLNLAGGQGGINFPQIFTCNNDQNGNNQSALQQQLQINTAASPIVTTQNQQLQTVVNSSAPNVGQQLNPTASAAAGATTAYMLVPVPIQQLPQLAASQLKPSIQTIATNSVPNNNNNNMTATSPTTAINNDNNTTTLINQTPTIPAQTLSIHNNNTATSIPNNLVNLQNNNQGLFFVSPNSVMQQQQSATPQPNLQNFATSTSPGNSLAPAISSHPINDPQITSTNISPRPEPSATSSSAASSSKQQRSSANVVASGGGGSGLDSCLTKVVTEELLSRVSSDSDRKLLFDLQQQQFNGRKLPAEASSGESTSAKTVMTQLNSVVSDAVMSNISEEACYSSPSSQSQQQNPLLTISQAQLQQTQWSTTYNSNLLQQNNSSNISPASTSSQKNSFVSPVKTSPSPLTAATQSSTSQSPATQPPKREKRKKGPAPKLDGNELCQVCGDKASGYHYGVLSCEGCKGFFRRAVINKSKSMSKCKNDGNCEMDPYMRRKCPKCRLDKCRRLGMNDQKVLSEYDGRSKRQRKDASSSSSSSHVTNPPHLFDQQVPPPSLTSHQRNLVEMLQANEQRFQWPTQEDVDKVTPWVEGSDSHRSRASRFAHFTELAILIVQLVVEFTKHLPGFLSVSQEDQIVLLKACTIEVMLLRAAKQYDKKSKAINFLNGKFYDKNSFYRAGMQVEFVDPIFDFCNSMSKLDLDEAEFALLVAINTFSADRQNITDTNSIDKIQRIQDSYVKLLNVYTRIHRPNDPLVFPRILMKLVELRSLNNYHSEQIFLLKVQDKQLPPLLAEIWDM